MSTFYDILGVPISASISEIRAAYRQLAVKYHPDKNPDNPNAGEYFKEINAAYQVLSDPYRKARYDLTISFSETIEPETTQRPVYTYRRRNNYRYKPIEWQDVKSKENLTYTFYAFLFTLSIGLLVIGGIRGAEYWRYVQEQKRIEERKEIYRKATYLAGLNRIHDGLAEINKLGILDYPREREISDFKHDLLSQIFRNANQLLSRKEYEQALSEYYSLEGYSIAQAISYQKNVAECHMGLKQYDAALKVFSDLTRYDFEKPYAYLKSARIYKIRGNNQAAIELLNLANKVCINEYRSFFGPAYLVFISSVNIPHRHYPIYQEAAQLHYEMENYENAAKAANWMMSVWVDSLDNHAIFARSNYEMGNHELACKTYYWLRERGYERLELDCDNSSNRPH